MFSEYMMKEVQEEVKGITIGRQNCTNLRYADDAVFLGDNESNYSLLLTKLMKYAKTMVWR